MLAFAGLGKSKRGVSRKQKRSAEPPVPFKQFKQEIYEGLQIPSTPAKEAKLKVREVVAEPVMTNDEIKAREGTYFTDKEVKQIFDEDEKKVILRMMANDPTDRITMKELLASSWYKSLASYCRP
jgi:serine/threonine protein kinase